MATKGNVTAEDVQQERERQRRHNLEQQAHQANFQSAFEGGEVEYLREMVKTHLDPGSVRVLDNYISPDFILSYIESDELHEFKMLLEIKLLRVFRMHPPEGGVSGQYRAYCYDDSKAALEPLDERQREILRTYKDGILQRVRRSVEGFQQDKIGENTSRVETVEPDSDGSSLGGFF